jgi:hypothetical protein
VNYVQLVQRWRAGFSLFDYKFRKRNTKTKVKKLARVREAALLLFFFLFAVDIS